MIKPLRDLLYIIPLPPEEMTESGLLFKPDTATPRTTQGVVKYRGPLTTGEIKVGDHVIFSGYDGDEIVLEGEGLLILLPEYDIDAVWVDSEDTYVYTGEQAGQAMLSAAAQIARESYSSMEKKLAVKIGVRAKELFTDSQFAKELFF